MRLTRKCKTDPKDLTEEAKELVSMLPDYDYARNELGFATSNTQQCLEKLGQLEDIEDELGTDLITFLKGVNPDTCFMEITKDKEFYFIGDAYYGNYTKEELLKLIRELLFMYWALTKEEFKNE